MNDWLNITSSIINSKFKPLILKLSYNYIGNYKFYNYENRVLVSDELVPKNVEPKIIDNVLFGSDKYTKIKVYDVWYGYYLQPTERVYKYDFEVLFGLGLGNDGYKDNLTLFIPK